MLQMTSIIILVFIAVWVHIGNTEREKDFRFIFWNLSLIKKRISEIETLLASGLSVIASVHLIFDGKREKQMILKVNQSLKNVSIEFDDKFEHPIENPENVTVAWSLTDPSLGAFTPNESGLGGALVPSGSLGSCKLQANIQAGDKQFMAEADIDFVPGDIDHVSIKLGDAA